MNENIQNYPISTRLLIQEALNRGYELSYFPASSVTGTSIIHAVKKGRELYFKSTSPITTPYLGYLAAEDKVLTYSLLSARSVNMPFTKVVSPDASIDDTTEFLKDFDSVVVKPAATNHGDGVTVGVKTVPELEKAIEYARKAGGAMADIIVQQEVKGREYRFLVVDGKVVAVASRRAPYVTGDGVRTIKELIAEKNNEPNRGTGHDSPLTFIDASEVATVKGDAFMDSAPEASQEIEVLHTSNLSKGGEAADCTDDVSPTLKKLAVDAARGCFLSVAGVDIMTNDLSTETLDESYVIEVNKEPGIRMHQFPSSGEGRNVAKAIFKAFEKTSRPVDKKVKVVGRAEKVKLSTLGDVAIPARIDTGAVVSALWASAIKEVDGELEFELFDKTSPLYTGEKQRVKDFSKRTVASSMGHVEERYVIKTTVVMKGKAISARFTLANRATQTYPILIGRNVLRNNFVVDVYMGKPDRNKERERRQALETRIKESKR
jgi:D-alanine-D-alanine ligase-like ATP-grasp enzyme